MKNYKNILRYALLLAVLAVGGNAWATYYIIGSGSMGLDNANGVEMSGDSYTHSCSSTGTVWFRVYSTASTNDASKCYYASGKQGQSFTASLSTGYSIIHGAWCQFEFPATSGTTYTISISSGGVLTITTSGSSYTITTGGSNCSFYPTSQSISSSGSGYFDVTPSTGYKLVNASVNTGSCSPTNLGNATSTTRITVSSPTAAGTLTVTTAAITFTLTAEAGDNGSVSPASRTGVAYNGSTTFEATPDDGYSIDQTNTTFSGTGNLSYSGNVITISNITAAGTLSVEFKDDTDYTPIVHFGAMPTQGGANGNVITVGGYLVDRKCKTVSASGFYWGKSITDCLAHDSGRKFTASDDPDENGDPFSGTTDLTDPSVLDPKITTGTNIFFQAYVTTDGGTGYSDIVGFFYNPCHGISSVTLSPSSVSIAPGFEQVFSVVARSAGDNPTYVWKWTPDGGAETTIEGANTDTYKFTMADPAVAGSLKVVVSEDDCGSSSNSTATISTCDAPDITLTADKSSTTPWVDVTLTATGDPDVYEWSATEGAEITDADESEATFRAPEGNYTVSFTASTDDCVSEVTKTVDIEVQPDSEQCNP